MRDLTEYCLIGGIIGAGNCKGWNECVRSTSEVESARLAIAKEIRQKVGNDFIIMGNVNWIINDPVSQYMSGVFLELWKTTN
ncbi:MAG: hypothetical protein CM15mP45_04440 [Deltaproteobacteria bacterium]|nr:MAG: hypothetical protein CM15mP45_04440 [Deltaproteobacteria bacterium]